MINPRSILILLARDRRAAAVDLAVFWNWTADQPGCSLGSCSLVLVLPGYALLRTNRNDWIHITTDGKRMWVEMERTITFGLRMGFFSVHEGAWDIQLNNSAIILKVDFLWEIMNNQYGAKSISLINRWIFITCHTPAVISLYPNGYSDYFQ